MMSEAVEDASARREFIKYALRLQGSSMAAVSRELGVTQSYVSQVCDGSRSSPRIRSAIAQKLNQRPEELWPREGCKNG